MGYLDRIEALVGAEAIERVANKRVLICGCGGVGSFVAEALARSGVGCLTLVDFDVVEETNLNRQLMTKKGVIGNAKVEVLRDRIVEVSDCKVNILNCYIDDSFEIGDVDYVVDCIDSLKSKFELVKKAQSAGIPILCSMGSAKRLTPANIKRTYLDKTQNDPLAKAFRNLVKKERYNKRIPVVYCDKPADPCKEGVLGSSVFTVGSVGLFIAGEVYKDLIK